MTPYDDEQVRMIEELMPEILFALQTADDAARGYGYNGSGGRYDITAADGLANIKAVELGMLLDQLGNWCWCENNHEGPCPRAPSPRRTR